MPQRYGISGVSDALAPHLEALIEANKEMLIRSAVVDHTSRDKLLEINRAIASLRLHDPNLVAAWGLGCGGSCLVGPGNLEVVIR